MEKFVVVVGALKSVNFTTTVLCHVDVSLLHNHDSVICEGFLQNVGLVCPLFARFPIKFLEQIKQWCRNY